LCSLQCRRSWERAATHRAGCGEERGSRDKAAIVHTFFSSSCGGGWFTWDPLEERTWESFYPHDAVDRTTRSGGC
jgi:hypothetical protein